MRRVGVIAPSSAVPRIELKMGVRKLRDAGFEVSVHPQCARRSRFFAGTDHERLSALVEYAYADDIDVLWSARGGYGAARFLEGLAEVTRKMGKPPRKLFVGYSDSTALTQFLREKWGWSTLHAPMPGLRDFMQLRERDWRALVAWVAGADVVEPWDRLKLVHGKVARAGLAGELVGGNLSVLCSLLGTPFAPRFGGKLVFLEDVSEALYRVDRLAQQLRMSRALHGARAIVLGDFLDCGDSVARALRKEALHPQAADFKPLRPRIPDARGLREIFTELAESAGLPLFIGLPAGHGPGHCPVPLGAQYRLSADGRLELLAWKWLG